MVQRRKKLGFSLVELVVVIVIIGILAAIAVPRLSRGSSGANEASLSANLATIRHAIHLYAAEHNNTFPGPDGPGFTNQLTMFTDKDGNTSATRDQTHIYGPYLVSVPRCPVGENTGSADILISADSPPTPVPGGGEGWVYNKDTGEFTANTTQTDQSGVQFNEY